MKLNTDELDGVFDGPEGDACDPGTQTGGGGSKVVAAKLCHRFHHAALKGRGVKMFSFKAKMASLFKREFPIVSGFVLLSIMISCDTSSAINVTPEDVLQKTYLSEVNQLAPNAYVHFRNGVVLVESGMFVLPVRDLEIPIGGSSFILERSYNNKASSKGMFGVGWKFNFGMRLEGRGEHILIVEPGAGLSFSGKCQTAST